MPHPCPHHCPPGGGSGGGAAATVIALVLIGAVIARPVIHAAEIILQVVLITVSALAGVAVLAAAAAVAVKIRRRRRLSRPTVRVLPARPARALPAPPRALPAGRAAGRRRQAPAPGVPDRTHLPWPGNGKGRL
jgi:hypothetical protein